MTRNQPSHFDDLTEGDLRRIFDEQEYVAETEVVTTVLLALRLGKPLLIEGEPGSGKTELAKVLADGFGTELIRLQCYEGLTAENALYEWNYSKQLLSVQAADGDIDGDNSVFTREFLLDRPLLRALDSDADQPEVLLIDEVDRADEEFEALLLEVLSDFQLSVPELGTLAADHPPVVVITSNRTRGLSDALKRRCIFLHIEPPTFEKEYEVVRRKVPQLDAAVAAEVCGAVQRLRDEPLRKQPGTAETLDWARAIAALRTEDASALTVREIETTIGTLLKEVEDNQHVDTALLEQLQAEARNAREEEPGAAVKTDVDD
jgi:MoxR-like ATPase